MSLDMKYMLNIVHATFTQVLLSCRYTQVQRLKSLGIEELSSWKVTTGSFEHMMVMMMMKVMVMMMAPYFHSCGMCHYDVFCTIDIVLFET